VDKFSIKILFWDHNPHMLPLFTHKPILGGDIRLTDYRKMFCITDVLGAISDDKSLLLFNTIALSGCDGRSQTLLSKLNLTRKQFYSRISRLIKTGLVNRRSGEYSLTSLGRILYNAQTTIGNAVNNYWKLKAIDSFKSDQLPKEEYIKIIHSLIQNEKIRKELIVEPFCRY